MLELLSIRTNKGGQKVSDFGLLNSMIYLNKHAMLAEVFLEVNGGTQLITDSFRQSGSDTQILYYTLLNIWLLSFVQAGIDKFIAVPKYGVLKNVCEVLQKLSREKLTRVAFMIFKNVENNQACLELLIDAKLIKITDTLLKGNIKTEELIKQIQSTNTILENNIKVLSNFDKYQREINSDSLEWSSVHT
jgi:V-type H+-transporting ATPase subunit H